MTFPSEKVSQNGQDRRAIENLVLVITLLLIFLIAARTPLDTDMWWHLRAGEETLRTGHILQTDIFSFTRTGAHWTNVYWLADLGMALLFRWLGFFGLGLGVTSLAVLSMALVYLQCEGPIFLKSAALLLGSIIASVVWSPRPQLITMVLLALTGYVLYLYKWRGKDWLWALPLIFLLWANVHGGFPLGIMLVGALIAGEALNHLLGSPAATTLTWRRIARLVIWSLVCGVAIIANPEGVNIYRLPFQTVGMQVLQQFIPEWASPNFHQILEQSILWLLFAVFIAVALAGRRMDAVDLLAVVVFAYMALLARRNFGPFALVATPVLTRYGAAAFQNWRENAPWLAQFAQFARTGAEGMQRRRRLQKVINLALVGLLAILAIGKLYIVTYPAVVRYYEAQGYPTRAIGWLSTSEPGGRVLNEYNWGGYIQWKLPGFPVFVDGRTDLYGDVIIKDWITAVQTGSGWQAILSRYQVDLVLLAPDRPLLKALPAAGWKLLYQDDQAIIFGRK